VPRPKTGIVKQCDECGKDIYCAPSEIDRRRYCDRICERAAVAKRTDRTCAYCGAKHQRSPSMVGRYCSNKCYHASRSTRTSCAVCGRNLTQQQAVYCSRDCILEGRRTLEERPCEVCGTVMRVQPHQFGKRRVCSKKCNDELKRLKGPGARVLRRDGYWKVYYPTHPNADRTGYVLEHRLVMSQQIGRPLTKAEEINHINHDRGDNRLENLEIVDRGTHARESNAWGKKLRLNMHQRLAEYEQRFGPLTDG